MGGSALKPFKLEIPARIHFGQNITEKAIAAERQLFDGSVMLVYTGRTLKANGHVERVRGYILAAGAREVLLYGELSPNPDLEEIRAAVGVALQGNVTCVVGLGGGSAIDSAKAIAAGAVAESIDDLGTFLFDGISPAAALPIVAIPTTAGTGSEMSKGAIISSKQHRYKGGMRGTALYPSVAIIDPVFTFSMPKRLSMETGFDVLTHATESYISLSATPFSDMLAEKVIVHCGKALPRLAKAEDPEARETMSYASMLAGINVGNVGNALPHRLQYPAGALADMPHAAGLAALYPAWIYHAYPHASERFNTVASWLTGTACNTRSDVLNAYVHLMEIMDIRYSLADFGIKTDDIGWMVEHVMGSLASDPSFEQDGIVQNIYQDSFVKEDLSCRQ